MSVRLADTTWPEAQRDGTATVLAVPVGATEQHGPHLPLSTDTDIAVAIADGLAHRQSRVVVAPAIAYGSSGEHADFPGTLSIGQPALELLLVELGRSASATFSRVLLISTHGGNREPVLRAQRRLRDEGRDVRVFVPGWTGDAHAGRLETSVMVALSERRVRVELAIAGNRTPLEELLPTLKRCGVRAISRNGVLGDPAGASPAQGRALLGDAIAAVVKLVDEWRAPAR